MRWVIWVYKLVGIDENRERPGENSEKDED